MEDEDEEDSEVAERWKRVKGGGSGGGGGLEYNVELEKGCVWVKFRLMCWIMCCAASRHLLGSLCVAGCKIA